MAINTCKEWMVPCKLEQKQALGHRFWLLLEEPTISAPACLQTFFFSPSNFKIKKGIKKKKKKTSIIKKPIFRMKICYFRALGLNSVCCCYCCCYCCCWSFSLAIAVYSFFFFSPHLRQSGEKYCDHYLAHGGRCLRKAGFPEEQLHTISCIF